MFGAFFVAAFSCASFVTLRLESYMYFQQELRTLHNVSIKGEEKHSRFHFEIGTKIA